MSMYIFREIDNGLLRIVKSKYFAKQIIFSKSPARKLYLYLSRAFLAFYDRGGGGRGVDSNPPPENNVIVELGQ